MGETAQRFFEGLRQTTLLEFIAVLSGIASVWFSKKENILVYPTGLVNTTIYIYLSLTGNLFGEASVNFYYTIMNIYGWVLWSKKDQDHNNLLIIKHSSGKEWVLQLVFFGGFYLLIFMLLSYLKADFAPGALPAADAFASATAYTGMWLMAKKKVESWYWWIATDIASIPLYFTKGFVFTSFQFMILLVLAIPGLISWHKKAAYASN
ncbi:nicotinamide riboside transporter PnuC [Segetibacter sp. 3557_3]|uniref:nicotinamide riboside transporter PnuC n=1 Tax=Segetibacter sp. 3557_3 TaxID=2547429 RepID=UPI001404E98B|nr:nicotinamide riboside transporter PnuC [Segetibacter sp. 3557_3]